LGLLRLLLALSVVLAHTGGLFGYHMTGGLVAVQAFFMISGFYMALILSDKYAEAPLRLFITNRLLRIFPVYWVMVGLTVAWCLLCAWQRGQWARLQPYIEYGASMTPATIGWLGLTNLLLTGHESSVFLEFNATSGRLQFNPDFQTTRPAVHQFMLIPQAWSLSLELGFYLLAPFLLRRRTITIAAVAVVALMLRVWIYYGLGWHHDPWTYRFLPLELALFLAGALSYRVFVQVRRLAVPDRLAGAAVLLVWTGTLSYQYLPVSALGPWPAYVVVFFALPALFSRSTSSLDRFLGELSYPIYASHLFVMMVMSARVFGDPDTVPLRTVVVTLLLSVLLHALVNAPVDRWRQRRLNEDRAERAAPRDRTRSEALARV